MNESPSPRDVRSALDRLVQIGRWYAARPHGSAPDEIESLIAADTELARIAKTARTGLAADVVRRAGPFDPELIAALMEVPRERFVRPTDIAHCTVDSPLLLDDGGLATISAPHAYLLSFRVLGLRAGDHFAELGAGSGYGAALASRVVGPGGAVVTIEIDEALASRAARLLAGLSNVRVVHGDAGAMLDVWRVCPRISVAFAVASAPTSWIEAIPAGGAMVVPVGPSDNQRLLRFDRRQDGALAWSDHGAVRYVPDRGTAAKTPLAGGAT